MTASPQSRSAPAVLKDSYGFVVKRDYHDLFKQYAPIWVKEEAERSNLWASFLLSFAPGKTEEIPADCSVEKKLLEACELGLPPFLSAFDKWRAQQHTDVEAPMWLPQLRSLVQAGLPRDLRGRLWPRFLGTHMKREAGAYDSLVHKALGGTKYGRKRSGGGGQPPHPEERSSGHSRATSNGSTVAAAVDAADCTPSVVDAALTAPISAPEDLTGSEACSATSAAAAAAGDAAGDASRALPAGRTSSQKLPPDPTTDAAATKPAAVQPKSTRRRRGPELWHPSTNDWNVQIEKDLHRTFPGHPVMNRRGRCALRRILAAYSRRNDSVGYCQGMNFVAGAMLLFMGEEDAFWCLCAIVEDLLPGYFSHDLIAAQVDQLVFKHMVDQRFPTLCAHLLLHSVNVSSMAVNWFLTIFVTSLPLESTLRVWDVLFFDRCASVLFRCSLALVDIYAQALMATVDSIDAFSLLHSMAPMSFDASRLIDMACIAFSSLTIGQIQSLRTAYLTTIMASNRNDGSSDEDAAWTASDDDGSASTGIGGGQIDSPSAIAAEGDFYYDTCSDDFSDDVSATGTPSAKKQADVGGELQTLAPLASQTSGLQEVREYVTAMNSSAAAVESTSRSTPKRTNVAATEVLQSQSRQHGGAPGQVAEGRGSGSASTSRDGGLHAAMGAASAVSQKMKSLATPASARRSLFGRTRRRSVNKAVSGAPVTALSAEDDLLGSLGSRSTLAAEAAYNIAATPFKTAHAREITANCSPLVVDSCLIGDVAAYNTTPTSQPPLQADTTAQPAAEAALALNAAKFQGPASAADRARRHIQEASSVVARTLNNGYVGGRALGSSTLTAHQQSGDDQQSRHAAAMAQVLAVVEGLEEELHAAEAACHDAETEAQTSGRNARDARAELVTAIAELQDKATVVDRLHDKLLGVTSTLAFFDSELEAKERALSMVRSQVAERDSHIAHRDALIAQLQTNQREKNSVADSERPISPTSGSFFRKFISAASTEESLQPAASTGSIPAPNWTLAQQLPSSPSLQLPDVTDAPGHGNTIGPSVAEARDSSSAAAPSRATHSESDAQSGFVPRNLDEALPPKPRLQPLIVRTSEGNPPPPLQRPPT